MFNTELPPDSPQWVVPQPLLSDEKLYLLFAATFDPNTEADADRMEQAKWFAQEFPEFGKGWEWYWTEYLRINYDPVP